MRPPSTAYLDAVQAHANESHWWNHASFMLPLLGFLGLTIPGLIFGWAEATGFGAVPRRGARVAVARGVVYMARHGDGDRADRAGRPRAPSRCRAARGAVESELERIERVETFGNVRWKLVERGGEHISIEGEIADIPSLIERAGELSGVEPDGE